MNENRPVAYRNKKTAHFHHSSRHICSSSKRRDRSRNILRVKKNVYTKTQIQSKTHLVEAVQVFDHIKQNPLKNIFKKKDKKSEIKADSSNKTTSTSNKKRKKHGKHYALKMFLLKLAIVGFIFWFVYQYIFGITILYGNYMYPSVRDGDLVISYKLQKPVTNDLVLYKQDGELVVGRVVAKENAVIRYNSETETYSVNGVTPSESIFYSTTENKDADIQYPYTVPEGTVYVLCDHREDYTDSRTYEAIPESSLQGVVVFVIRRRGF